MKKFLKFLFQGRSIFDHNCRSNALYRKVDNIDSVFGVGTYTHNTVKYVIPKDKYNFTFKGWDFKLIYYDLPNDECISLNIPFKLLMTNGSVCRFYFLLAENADKARKPLIIPVDTYTFMVADGDICIATSEDTRIKWLIEELVRWSRHLCNTDKDITEWRYLRSFFAWLEDLKYDVTEV